MALVFTALVYAQLGLGALVAGLRAGLIYNTWPLMGSSWIPGEAFKPNPATAMLNDPVTVQFDHRIVAYVVVAFAVFQAVAALRAAPGAPFAARALIIAVVALLQMALGIATLVSLAPLELALAHQALALALFGLAVIHLRATQMERA
jgi:cytochrome c oxidase assembly protein subunit 15